MLSTLIEQAFDGNVKAALENGKIVVTDKFSGVSQFSMSLAYNANGSSATLTLPAMAVSSEGAATTASLAGFAPSDFTRTQIAQDSKVKVDGFPIKFGCCRSPANRSSLRDNQRHIYS